MLNLLCIYIFYYLSLKKFIVFLLFYLAYFSKLFQMDDQIALLINSWCELLLLSCCYRSMSTPNEIRISHEKSVTVEQAQVMGLSPVIERMINLTEHLRRLQVDQYEYVSLKVIILLTSGWYGCNCPLLPAFNTRTYIFLV